MITFNLIIWIIAFILPTIEKSTITVNLAYTDINIASSIETNRTRECRNAKNYELNQDTDIRTKTYLEATDYDYMLAGTELEGIGNAIVEAENQYSVNGLYIMGLACLESAYGTSGYAKKRNNLVGWNAVDSNPDLATYFNSKDECILFVAEKLSENYLNENGCYFSGYTAPDIDVHYCTDTEHATKIIQIVKNLERK